MRFFQTYMIPKDPQYSHIVATRPLSVRRPRVQVTLVASVITIVFVVIMAGLLAGAFALYPVRSDIFVPRTKFDWVREAVREGSTRGHTDERMHSSRRELGADMSTLAYGDVVGPTGRQYVGLRL